MSGSSWYLRGLSSMQIGASMLAVSGLTAALTKDYAVALPGIVAGGAALQSGSGLAKAGREERVRELGRESSGEDERGH